MRIGVCRRERGSNLVEAALVMPLLLIMMAAVADLGRAYFGTIAVIDAAREGARYGVSKQDGPGMCATAVAEAQDQHLSCVGGLQCDPFPGHVTGDSSKVKVSCDFPLIMGGLVGRSSIPMSYTAVFRFRSS